MDAYIPIWSLCKPADHRSDLTHTAKLNALQGLLICWFVKSILLPSFSQYNGRFLTFTSSVVIVWIIRGFHQPPKPYCWKSSPEGTKEMWLLMMVLMPQGELHVGFPPAVFRKGLVNVL